MTFMWILMVFYLFKLDNMNILCYNKYKEGINMSKKATKKNDYAKKLAAAIKNSNKKAVVNKTFATSQC